MSIYVWTGRINYPAMRWPCPYGYHVPTPDDWNNVVNAWTTLWAWTSTDGVSLCNKLKIPMSGCRLWYSSTWDFLAKGSWAYCYQSTAFLSGGNASWRFSRFASWVISTNNGYGWCYALPIRPFKDEPVVPTSSWTTIYQGTWSAGIFWNSSSWLISISSNGTTWYTIADKNLWATTVYNTWDTMDANNCGWYFQWGNNYMFPYSWNLSWSTTQIDASAYWPWNWYYDTQWRYRGSSPYKWDTSNNLNLRWWVVWAVKADVKDICVGAGVDDKSPAQWPCPDWFHVPIWGDWGNIVTAWVTLWAWTSSWWNNFSTYMKLPLSWYRSGNSSTWSKSDSWTYWNYWYNTNTSSTSFSYLRFSSSTLAFNYSWNSPCHWLSIRPFKNNPVVPDSTWTVLYQGTWNAGIYWSKWLWLISISKDGTTWYTIADKNLGAKKVWNSWDTLNEDNCGWYFQYGNNYMFPYSWNLSGSTTKVDVIGFWPWNYYMDSQRRYSTNASWMSQWNGDLRWYQTWKQKKWNVKQVYVGTTPVRPTYNPWIYWNKAKWLISISSDWKNWITIADKNLGAKVVYNDWDTLSQDNCWCFYQRWNNYGFPRTGSITTSSTRVSTSTYSYTNPYYSKTFITYSSWDWSSNQNDNLWGNTADTLVARQWPCPTDRHVGTKTEWTNLLSAMTTLWAWTTGNNFKTYVKMPIAWYRARSSWSLTSSGTYWRQWTSTCSWTLAWYYYIESTRVIYDTQQRSEWFSIRPFKNEPVVPDNSRAVLYQPS